MQYKAIKSWKLHSLFVMAFLFLFLFAFANTTLISASAIDLELQTDLPSPQRRNTPINLTAELSEPEDGWLYKFSYQKIEDDQIVEEGIIKDYGPENDVIWTPTEPGHYRLLVHAKKMEPHGLRIVYRVYYMNGNIFDDLYTII